MNLAELACGHDGCMSLLFETHLHEARRRGLRGSMAIDGILLSARCIDRPRSVS